MTQSPTFYRTLTQEELAKRTKPIPVVLDEHYTLEWQNDSSFAILCEATMSNNNFTRHMDTVIGILKLESKENHGTFLSIGSDNTIQVSQNSGALIATLDRHEDRIIAVREFSDGMIAVVTEDGKITLWNTKKAKLIGVIDAKTKELENICFLISESAIFIRSSKDAAIWTYDGEHIVTLKGINADLDKAYRLSSKNWLVWVEKGHPSLWSDEGDLLTKFSFNFDSAGGYVELDSAELLIRMRTNVIALFNSQGELIEQHSQDAEIEALFVELTESKGSARQEIKLKPNIDCYPHFRNAFTTEHNIFIPKDELKAQELTFETNSSDRKVWDFFIRPYTWGIRTTLKESVSSANGSKKTLDQKSEVSQEKLAKFKRKISLHRFTSWLFFIATLSVLAIGTFAFLNPDFMIEIAQKERDIIQLINKFPEAVAFSPTGVIAIFWLFFVRRLSKAKKSAKAAQSDLALQASLLDGNQQIINLIKDYRRRLVNQIPVLQQGNQNLYEGDFVRAHIDGLLNGKLKDLAMNQCGLEKDDIVFHTNEPLILPSWSLIQDKVKRELFQNKLVLENEYAIRSIKNGMVSAVQYIQYIFLTKDKIDVFTMYYDFITNKSVGKEANAFYYKDVTNITKREVDRENWLGDKVNNDIAATEIVLSVASGEQICLTILNEDSMTNMNKQSKENETISPELEIKKLEDEKQAIEADKTSSEDDKEDELQMLEVRLKDAQAGLQKFAISTEDNKAEEAIKNIRSYLKQHKKEVT